MIVIWMCWLSYPIEILIATLRIDTALLHEKFMQSLDDAEFTFRFRLSKPAFTSLLMKLMTFIRVTSTRTFGVWKCSFPVVGLTLRLSLPKVQAIIIATAVLHNICRNHNLEDVPSEVELPTAEVNDQVYYTEVQDVSERAALINNYFI
ncbi:unnamed protein product [Parnassius apollo]|uniref:(apollo) hypothetical protein n=1 Tax=Parnassius apollo TaxID=110799 RepID=A0A8S3WYE0_PARAO|nr:unnamed protein product [Parnassius apollo]